MGVACCHPDWSGIDLIVICLKLDLSGVTDCSALPPVILWSFMRQNLALPRNGETGGS